MNVKARLEELYEKERAEEHWKYLQRKHTGGSSNSKGNTYENYFAVYEIAKKFNSIILQTDTSFSTQAIAFVDDFLTRTANETVTERFQLKDISKLDWISKGGHSLADDFILQHQLSEADVLSIVVSNKEVADHLQTTTPATIVNFVSIIHFTTADSISNLVRTDTDFRNELSNMCAISKPATYVLETLAAIVLGTWDATNKTDVSLQTLLDSCYQQNPNYIKGFEQRISQPISEVLNSVKGFSFEVENGFVKWQYGETDEGIIPYTIGSRAFSQLENDIISSKVPVSFEDLEPYLS